VVSENDRPRISLELGEKSDSAISLAGKDGQGRLLMLVSPEGVTHVSGTDPKGNVRYFMRIGADELEIAILTPAGGQARVWASAGLIPRASVTDVNGKTAWSTDK
jgi:hypothetical protein